MARRLNEEKATVYAGVLNVSFALGCKLFPQIG